MTENEQAVFEMCTAAKLDVRQVREVEKASPAVVYVKIAPLTVDPLYVITRKLYPSMAKSGDVWGVSWSANYGQPVEELRFSRLP